MRVSEPLRGRRGRNLAKDANRYRPLQRGLSHALAGQEVFRALAKTNIVEALVYASNQLNSIGSLRRAECADLLGLGSPLTDTAVIKPGRFSDKSYCGNGFVFSVGKGSCFQ
jgi:hypothetical protein